MSDDRICQVCDGGPGNEGACLCGMRVWSKKEESPMTSKPYDTHDTRMSDSSLFDEVCRACGATDAPGSTGLDQPCPSETAMHKRQRELRAEGYDVQPFQSDEGTRWKVTRWNLLINSCPTQEAAWDAAIVHSDARETTADELRADIHDAATLAVRTRIERMLQSPTARPTTREFLSSILDAIHRPLPLPIEEPVDQAFAESHQWWGDFLEVRMRAIRALRLLGRSEEDIQNTLSLAPSQTVLLAAEADAQNAGRKIPMLPRRVRHRKRGSTYRVVGGAMLQVSDGVLRDNAAVTVYRSEADGRLWVRGSLEFLDGRFEQIP